MLPDAIVDLAARGPTGLFCRKQVLKLGFNDVAIKEWRIARLIERVAPGWYRLAGVVVPPLQCLYLPTAYLRFKTMTPRAIIGGYGALAGLGVPGFDLPCRPSVMIQHGCRVRVTDPPWSISHAHLSEIPVVNHAGLRLAGPARSLADLHVEEVGMPDLIAAVDATRNHLRLTQSELIRAWEGMGHPGAQVLLALAKKGVFDTESGGERRVLNQVFTNHPPVPDCQVQVTSRYRVDFAYIFAGLILEYYGEEVHANRVDRDGVRSHELRSLGWDCYVITKSMVHDPVGLAESVHTLRREREQAIIEGRIRRPPLPPQPERRLPLRTLVPLG